MMIKHVSFPAGIAMAYLVYFVAALSPGPGNLSLMSVAMNAGRVPALTLAFGIVSGSFTWAVLATLGLSAVLATCSGALMTFRLLGGIYLLWLAMKAARSAWMDNRMVVVDKASHNKRISSYYLRGLGLHLTNPKAILTWLAIVSITLPPGSGKVRAATIVIGCMGIDLSVSTTYALLFSTSLAQRVYRSIQTWLEGTLALVFTVAGCRLLLSKR